MQLVKLSLLLLQLGLPIAEHPFPLADLAQGFGLKLLLPGFQLLLMLCQLLSPSLQTTLGPHPAVSFFLSCLVLSFLSFSLLFFTFL